MDKLIISADTTDEGASKVVSGNENLQMGENRVTLKVTAQDGETTKEYVIVVTKQEGGPNESTQDGTGEESFEQFQMTVSRRSFTVMAPDASVQVPEGLVETAITIDGHAVKGWVWGNETEHQYCVIYAMNEAGEKNFYRYDLNNNERTIQRYFEDPAAQGAVSEEVYTQLADKYDSLRNDYSLFRTLLIAAIVVALIFMVLLIVSVTGKKKKSSSAEKKTARSEKKPVKEEDEDEDDLYGEEVEEPEDEPKDDLEEVDDQDEDDFQFEDLDDADDKEPEEDEPEEDSVDENAKEDTEDEKYSEFLESYRVQELVRKYSDYIRYPIRMEVEKSRMKEQPEGEEADEEKAPEYETYTEVETLNSMVPIWRKNKNELTDEDYNSFYKEKFFDYSDPLKVIHTYTEGAATYHALLFIPAKAPYNYYTRDYEKGLKLYASGVLIMDSCKDLLPDHFSFVKGLVDSEDLSLNISREMLQHDRQLKVIASRLEKKIKSELLSMLKNDREKYEEFFKNFGLQLKYGVYNGFGANKELLQDLLLFYSSSEQKLVTLEEYVSRMKEDQKYIYYAGGESREQIERLPQTELVKDKGYEILYLTDDVDEFALQMMHDYSEKEFKSVSASDLDLDTEEEKKEFEKQTEENKDLLTFMKDALDGKVKAVVLSKRLKSHPVCLSNEGMLSIEMEKVLNAMPNDQKVKAERVLEVNASHPIFEKLSKLYAEDQEKLKTYAQLLYTQAELIEGMPVEDPVAFSNAVCELMV